MPSRDPLTGKRLGGTSQRKLAAQTPAIPAPTTRRPIKLAELPPPPLARGIVACEAWASSLAMMLVAAAEQNVDAARVKVLCSAVRTIGQLSNKARRSELATELRWRTERQQDGEDDATWREAEGLLAPTPPSDPLSALAWTFLRLCHLAYQIAQADPFVDTQWTALLASCAAVGFVPCKAEQRALIRKHRGTRPGPASTR